ncbi:hypothetical protein [Ferruginibacter sp. HRS2-29]|uniref:hypothetical protein n=1 Tax=Ferruginibacter sp. HRS2-29 TaxID=2487334 RepID=UPI0020CCED1E|nr:hypothetical protein [Ferruginibacter sp. HRS2-29]MCP9751794.1 hypothetical protein [Ferruginibacter sp. HRS2-29]
MKNSIPDLMTVAACDHQITLAKTALVAMQFAQSQVDKKNFTAITKGPDYEREVASTQQQIAMLEAGIPGMPEGPGKVDANNNLQQLKADLINLLKKEGSYGVDSLFEQQGEYIALGGKIEAFQTFIDALNARKAEL